MSLDDAALTTVASRKPGTILVIEKDTLLTEQLTRHFGEAEIQVKAAQNGTQGYWLALSEQPDAVVTELSMTNSRGGRMLECLKDNAHTEQIPVVVVADQDYPGMQSHLTGLGAAAVLPMPEAIGQVASAVEHVLSSQSPV
jgi:DNA-binding response OmpR family regulator